MIERLRAHRGVILELFVLSNLAFLTLDIWVAHSVNAFAHWAEWIPFWFSLLAAAGLGAALLARPDHPRGARRARLALGWASVAVGVLGFLLHLESQFFQLQSLKSLVYTAPFAAPLAYTGLGLLLILNQLETPGSRTWSGWVVALALGGFVGNFALALCDHAQNGFFSASEWIPVVSSALAIGFLSVALREHSSGYFKLTLLVLAAQVVVGLLGFGLHARAIAHGPADDLLANVIHGAPVFAPLLFPNLAILAAFGVWSQQHPVG